MSNNPQIEYDVFVSFRGKDIRQGFLSHLIEAFPRKQITAFVDDKLRRGDDISPSLLGAIEGSFISLIIFSEDYASSHWCLEELVKIVECKEKKGQIVIPVFYHVDPTDVRHQKKSFGNALHEHEKKYNLSKVQMWRDALNKSANLSGIKSSDFRNDAELLEEIVNLVLMRLSKHPVNSKGLIGIDKSIAHLESLLCEESKAVRVIGIWGMGGIGKTTIAEELFNKLCFKYEGCCFLANVREESRRHGILSLKEKLFSALLVEDVQINTPNGLSSDIGRRIGRKKVLIILDDVDDPDQVEKLFGTRDCFRSGSRIIVTTRDKQVLNANKVDDIYQVGELSYGEALELFNLNAFNKSHLDMEYYELSKRVVHYAKGIPLVLKVLGHLLCGKDKVAWESQLDKLKKLPSKKVHDVMRLSYDDLDHREQKIFLDLAYHESDNSVTIVLERLKDKALINVSKDNYVSMHDIIQEMAWEIVRQESSEEPGNRSRLGDPDDVFHVLKNDTGTRAIRSITADLPMIKKLKLSSHMFVNLNKLQFFDFYYEYSHYSTDPFPEGLQYVPTELRYLRWINCPLKFLAEQFSPEKLVILDLSCSQVEKLWDGVKNLENLKEVILKGCALLKELPDFSKATNLKVLDISYCEQLTSVHLSIFTLKKLESLNLSGCLSLTKLSSDSHLSSLCYLDLHGCRKLREFSVTSENMIELNLSNTCVSELPSSFGHQSKLEILHLENTKINSLPSSIKNLTRLRYLSVRSCAKLQALPELPASLETIIAINCTSLEFMLFPLLCTQQLHENRKGVEFWDCPKLNEDSLMAIGLNAQVNIMNFAYQHLSAPKYECIENYSDYNDLHVSYQAVYMYPGGSVPEWLIYKTTKDYIIIDLSSTLHSPLLGFIFCFILSKDKQLFFGQKLQFNITVSDGDSERKEDNVEIYTSMPSPIIALDHVCVVYDQRCSSYLNSRIKIQPKLLIKATALVTSKYSEDSNPKRVLLKGFGVTPINTPIYRNLIQQMRLRY
ncbi:putative disease resistance protein At4g11170 [Abrus precatorius]|uniref:Disease resistance protein At4g11170 n=1 Tax=Abrus precatorius TaxID=3816 RepID=A0A8B8K0L7_ABRPR|nr:putative disease resistance protein At4g11170 [Abrus precatorius]